MSKEESLKKRALTFPKEMEEEDLDESTKARSNDIKLLKKTAQYHEKKRLAISSNNQHPTANISVAKGARMKMKKRGIIRNKGANHDDNLALADAAYDAGAEYGPEFPMHWEDKVPALNPPGAYASGVSDGEQYFEDHGTVMYDNTTDLCTSDAPYTVNARLIQEDPESLLFREGSSAVTPSKESIPIAEIADASKTRRIVRGLIIALVVSIIVAVAIGVTRTRSRTTSQPASKGSEQGGHPTSADNGPMSAPPSDIPSWAPVPAPSLMPSFMPTITPWTLGQTIDGGVPFEHFGISLDVSDDGLTLAVGAPSGNEGMVRMYRFISGSWTTLGQNLTSSVPVRWFGEGLVLSGDGSTVAVAGVSIEATPFVEIFRFFSNSWSRIGRLTNVGYGAFQESVALSHNGRILAIGSPFNGTVSVFEHSNVTETWVQLGSKIAGRLPSDEFGQSVDLSSDGLTLLAGAPGINGTVGGGEAGVTGTPQTGYAGGFTYSYDTDEWTQLGTGTMQGVVPGDQTGWTVAISGNGLIAAVGAILNDVSGENAGTVRVFRYNTDNLSWLPYGNIIQGEAALDNSGWALDLSTDGSTIVIGAPGNKGRSQDDDEISVSFNAGHARVYEYLVVSDLWVQVGADIDGESGRDQSGYNVAISSDGRVVVVGAPYNNADAQIDAGQVRVYYAPTT